MSDEDLGSNLVDGVPMPEPKGIKRPKVSNGSEGKVRIVLDENDQIPPTGQFVGVNGRGYILRPGEEMDVPESVVGVLSDAVVSVPVQDPQTGQVLGVRERRRFPFTVVSRNV